MRLAPASVLRRHPALRHANGATAVPAAAEARSGMLSARNKLGQVKVAATAPPFGGELAQAQGAHGKSISQSVRSTDQWCQHVQHAPKLRGYINL